MEHSMEISGSRTAIVLLNTFLIRNKRYRVLYNAGLLVWEKDQNYQLNQQSTTMVTNVTAPHPTKTVIPIGDIISIEYKRKKIAQQSQQDQEYQLRLKQISNRFTIHYAAKANSLYTRGNSNKWRVVSVTMYNADVRVVKIWFNTIQYAIDEQYQQQQQQQYRPKRLLVFINPFGGKGQAMRVYEKYAKPIFLLAKCDVNVIVLQRSNQIQDILCTHNLTDHYDGITCVGGDGTFSELFNGLIYKEIIALGFDPEYPKYIPKPKIPIGIIPAGSTNTIAYCLHGTADIQTAVIHIVLGQINGLDLCSVSNRTGLLRMYASIMSYGYLGDVAAESERFRWMGPKRYDYTGFKKFMLNRGYDGEISLYLDNNSMSNPINGPGCMERCMVCANSMVPLVQTIPSSLPSATVAAASSTVILLKNNDGVKIDSCDGQNCANNWQHCVHDEIGNDDRSIQRGNESSIGQRRKIIKGKFFMINGANISCACTRSPNGFSKYCHLGDGCLDLVVIRHTSFFNNLKLILTLSSKKGRICQLPFVEIYRIRKFTFHASPTEARPNKQQQHNNKQFKTTQTIDAGSSEVRLTCSSKETINTTSSAAIIALHSRQFSSWNCDGEIINDFNVTVKSHRQLINVYRRGIVCPTNMIVSNNGGDDDNVTTNGCCFCKI